LSPICSRWLSSNTASGMALRSPPARLCRLPPSGPLQERRPRSDAGPSSGCPVRAPTRENNSMSQPVFFEAERKRFFRPLNSSRRELVAACLRALFDRLHGPTADYAHNLTREALRELLFPVVREYQSFAAEEGGDDELSSPDTDDPQVL